MADKFGAYWDRMFLASILMAGGLRMPALFSDHMVLQRQANVRVWGWGNPGDDVVVHAGWARGASKTRVSPDGTWQVRIGTGKAGGPYALTVESGSTLTFSDVMVGDVWVCSGQSNMEWPMTATDNAARDIAAANNSRVRLFQVKNVMKDAEQDDCEGSWQPCSPEAVKNFSAVAYHFANELSDNLHVAVGVIDTTWGGTEAELWTSEQGLRKLPEFAAAIDESSAASQAFAERYAAWENEVRAKDPGWGKWQDPAANDSDWTKVDTLAPWSAGPLKDFDGAVWYRGNLTLSKDNLEPGSVLDAGQIDDADQIWLNGRLIGATDGWSEPRMYKVPDGLAKVGENSVVVRVWDGQGEGGWASGSPTWVQKGGTRTPATGWRYKVAVAKSALPSEPARAGRRYSLLYNGMIHPLTPFAVKGAIWYQGESNVGRAFQYRQLFPAMIKDWRARWSQNIPFGFVQIAPFEYNANGASAELREAQTMTLRLKDTGMVVPTDVTGNLRDIHPQDKRTVGTRLAVWALGKVYGRGGVCTSPTYKSVRFQGREAWVSFSNASPGLMSQDSVLREFQVAGADRVFVPALARIERDKVVVWAEGVDQPVAVRFAWRDAPVPNLFCRNGLPVSPFRTDSWPGLTDNAKW